MEIHLAVEHQINPSLRTDPNADIDWSGGRGGFGRTGAGSGTGAGAGAGAFAGAGAGTAKPGVAPSAAAAPSSRAGPGAFSDVPVRETTWESTDADLGADGFEAEAEGKDHMADDDDDDDWGGSSGGSASTSAGAPAAAAGAAAVAATATAASTAKRKGDQQCPYCGHDRMTYDELLAHFKTCDQIDE